MYDCRESHRFQKSIDKLEKKYPRVKELKENFILIARDPRRFTTIPGEPDVYRILKTDELPVEDVPIVYILFEIIENDEEKLIEFLDITDAATLKSS
ncbi:MAG: hypothetical protein KF749_09430 [Bacteroidetes bacterium]|nr:hypothetical protein [Bacteroidota bacterium]MCW5894846.1 hypothetical protein [Bacteroidota bacterium]